MVVNAQVVIALLQNNQTISLPDVRRRALVESVRRASDSDEVFDMMLDSASSSPYLQDEQKQQLANAVMNGDLDDHSTSMLPTADAPIEGMMEMVRLMLSHSRKLLSLPSDRRRQITMAVHQTQTEEHLLDLVLQQLPTALSLDRRERELVANDVLDHRYYRLLLPDRFDCSEPLPRLGETQAPAECPICFDDCVPALSQVLQCCGQRFCSSCVNDLTQQFAECPLCRRTLPAAMPVLVEATAGVATRRGGRVSMIRRWHGTERNLNI